jgi:hypothetical protein
MYYVVDRIQAKIQFKKLAKLADIDVAEQE